MQTITLQELDIVQVHKLLTDTREIDGTDSVKRQPKVGDTGTIVHVLDASADDPKYMVECVDDNGMTVWLADFSDSDLEFVSRPVDPATEKKELPPGTTDRRRAIITAVAAILPLIFLGDCAAKMYPITKGDAPTLWYYVCGAEVGELPDNLMRGGFGGRLYLPRDGYFIYAEQGFHGEFLYCVPEAEALALFPQVVEYTTAHHRDDEFGNTIRDGFLSWHEADPTHRDAHMFVSKLREAELERRLATKPKQHAYLLAMDEAFGIRWQRLNRYWLNVVFEALFFAGVMLCVMWPLLWRLPPWRWWLHVGVAPFVLFTPFFLGYCGLSFTSAGPTGGALYPFALLVLRWLGPCLGSWDVAILNWLPKPLAGLTQGTGPMLSLSGGGCVGPLGSALVGAFIGGMAFLVLKNRGKVAAAVAPVKKIKLGRREKLVAAGVVGSLALAYLLYISVLGYDRFHEAAARGDVRTVRAHLASGTDPNECGRLRHNISFLGIPVLSRTTYTPTTALHFAIERGHADVVGVLLEAGADLELRGGQRRTAIMAAIYFGRTEVVRMLLEKEPDLTVKAVLGDSLLHMALQHRQHGLALELIRRGADVNAKGWNDDTPLHKTRDLATTKALLDAGADATAVNKSGLGVLHDRTDPESLRLLIAAGAPVSPSVPDADGPLHSIVRGTGNPEVISILRDAGASVNAGGGSGNTPLHLVWDHNTSSALIAAGADVNAKNNEGATPLHSASCDGDLLQMRLLIAAGADPTIEDDKGHTPLEKITEWAKPKPPHPVLVKVLRDAEKAWRER